jgi:hypothetical protein
MSPGAPPPLIGALGIGRNGSLPLSASATPCPGVTSGVRENLGELGAERQLAPPSARASRSLRACFSYAILPCPKLDKPKLPIAGEVWEV